MLHAPKSLQTIWIGLIAFSLVGLTGCVVDRDHGRDHSHDRDFHDHEDHHDDHHDDHGMAQPSPDALATIQ